MTKPTAPQPWFKFTPRDWRNDVELRQCSFAAQGLWVQLLCFAHEADPRGFILIEGKPPTAAVIAKKTGKTEKEVTALLTELEEQGVASRSEDKSMLYSRRMVRDTGRSEQGRENANKRWSDPEVPPMQTAKGSALALAEGAPKVAAMGDPKAMPMAPLMLESESESESKSSRNLVLQSTTPASARDAIFDRFCKLANISLANFRQHSQYLNLPAALHTWSQAGADPELDIWPTLERLTASHVAAQGRIPNSPTYFNRAVFEARDTRLADAARPKAKHYPQAETRGTDDYWNARLDILERNKFWADYEDGPAPGKPGCKVPNHLLEARAKPA